MLLDGDSLQVGSLEFEDEAGHGCIILLGIDGGESSLLDVRQHVSVEAAPIEDERPHAQPGKDVLQPSPQTVLL